MVYHVESSAGIKGQGRPSTKNGMAGRPFRIAFKTEVLTQLPRIERSRVARASRQPLCEICGYESSLCPLVAEITHLGGKAEEPHVIRMCELIATFGEPGHLPPDVSDLVDRLFQLPVGTQISATLGDRSAMDVASYFRVA